MAPGAVASMARHDFAERLEPGLIQPIIDARPRYGFLPHTSRAASLFDPRLQSR
jgi:hypothetical protein